MRQLEPRFVAKIISAGYGAFTAGVMGNMVAQGPPFTEWQQVLALALGLIAALLLITVATIMQIDEDKNTKK